MFNRAPLECKALIRAGFEYPGKLKKFFGLYTNANIQSTCRFLNNYNSAFLEILKIAKFYSSLQNFLESHITFAPLHTSCNFNLLG